VDVNLYLDTDVLVIDTPYVPEEVATIKRINGAKWNKRAKLWEIPVAELAAARDFVDKYGYSMTEEVARLTLPERKHSEGIGEDGDTVLISFPYERVRIKAVKQIPGITWDQKRKLWAAPKTSLGEVIEWSNRFGVAVPRNLIDEHDDLRAERQQMLEASRSVEADLEIPGLRATLLDYQKAGVNYITKVKKGFIADEMGLGKTLQAIAAIEKQHAYPCVVVCPPTLVLNWQKEYARWLPHRDCQVVENRKEIPQNYEVLVVGYSNIAHWAEQLKGKNGYVFDESHYCKNGTSQRTKAAKKIAAGAGPEVPVILLTGTPITNRPAEYAPQLGIIGQLSKFGGEWGFYRRYCDAFRDKWGQWHLEGASNLDELNDRLRSTCYIRRTKDQVLTELPPVVHDPVVVDGGAVAMKEYRKAERDIVQYLVDRAVEIAEELGLSPKSAAVQARLKAEANQHLVRISILRRLAAKAKMPAIEEWIEGRLAESRKVVVAAHHRDIVDTLADKYGGYKIQGEMEVGDIEAAKEAFQTDPNAKVMVLSIQAAKTGHTLTASQDVLFVELPWTPADVDQTYSRCHRIGQTGSVTATYLLLNGSIDEEIYNLIERKRSVVNQATDGGDAETEEVSVSQLIMSLFQKKS
jgi:SNF2 family DNA or RNA helicase